ncbi:MAG: UDP-N-acetylglucosamine diphosphorylase / glucose-phosphate thymidylyltransferase [Clostridiales bacterium]|nr:UDP-N-acetylglucosamine diphosphorylase / glucose-phosphate thymidylyltransferase [Clostridiales bacterium]
MELLKIKNLLGDLSQTLAQELLESVDYPWEALPQIGDFIRNLGRTLPEEEYEMMGEDIWIAKSAKIYPNTYIEGPTIIGKETQVRPGAFIRGNVLVGDGAVVGNSTELKNSILFNKVQVPHYNYVGDSILGYHAHMGAGAITSNVKSDRTLVMVNTAGRKLETGLKKMGAILGSNVEVGCGSVLNPGTIVGENSIVYPLSSVRGVVLPGSIYKKQGEIVKKR